jgi:uncharacterized protein YfaS (alpha-2-macroglobulin family)
MILETLVALGDTAKAAAVASAISTSLSSERDFSTQTTAYALLGLFKYGLAQSAQVLKLSYVLEDGAPGTVLATKPLLRQALPVRGEEGFIKVTNESKAPLSIRLVSEGVPPIGSETESSSGLDTSIEYLDPEGNSLDAERLEQGTELVVRVRVRNTDRNRKLANVTLSYMTPSGWEIRNNRLEGRSERSSFDYQDIRDDRVYTYFSLNPGEAKTFEFFCQAAYKGRYYHPLVKCEAMYDARVQSVTKGFWVSVE